MAGVGNCPRCDSKLVAGHQDQFCPQYHGTLLTLPDFRATTHRGFVEKFYSRWLERKNRRTIPCPSCCTSMIQLNIDGIPHFEVDSCPSCFSLWLDAGEEKWLYDLFVRHISQGKIRDLSSEENEILGKFVLEHTNILRRYELIERLGKFANKRLRFSQRLRIGTRF